MKIMGALATVGLVAVGAAAVSFTIASIPDIKRYLRITRM
jgi:hypothetical protein